MGKGVVAQGIEKYQGGGFLLQKIEHIDFQFLYALTLLLYLILIDYANCITLISISLNSSSDNSGTHSAISSSVIFPFFINLSAVSLALFAPAPASDLWISTSNNSAPAGTVLSAGIRHYAS